MTETTANPEQIAHWNDAPGRTWAELYDLLDRQIDDAGGRALDALALRPGERVVDVGCGCGRTTLTIARRVGPGGRVIGLDVSQPMVEVARSRAAAAGLGEVQFILGDAQTHALGPDPFDAIFSCFGVMFFADPVVAFRNLGGALRPEGRLAFLCWRSPAENPVMTRPMAAARHLLPPQAPVAPGAPGPFAFADADHVIRLLEAAGFVDVALAPYDAEMGGNSLDDSLTLAMRVGPLASALRANPDLEPQAREAVRAALLPCVRDGAVWQTSATWIVTARKP